MTATANPSYFINSSSHHPSPPPLQSSSSIHCCQSSMASRLVKCYFLLLQHVVLILSLIHYRNSIHKRSKLHRVAILFPESSPWQHVYDNADPQSFFSLTGVTREVFGVLLDIIYPAHDTSQWIVRRKKGEAQIVVADC